MVEHHLDMVGVVGSIPIVPTNLIHSFANLDRMEEIDQELRVLEAEIAGLLKEVLV